MSASVNDDFQAGIHDEELIQEFVIESRDHLAGIEPDFLTLEQCLDDIPSELINRIFRAIHSIKGASGFFGLTALKNLSHVMESLLMMV
jgi:two-component system chemotaxis sensor kinase CheA